MTYPMNTLLSLTNEQYHAAPGLGSSMLRDFITSPALYAAKHVHKTLPQDDTTALRLGSVVDAAILEPDVLAQLVALIPAEALNKDGHRKGGQYTEWAAAQGKKLLVKQDEWDDIRSMVDCVWACAPAVDLLNCTKKQQSVFWDREGLVLSKCKFDGVNSDVFFDLKTTADPLEFFGKSVRKYKYLTQLGWYTNGFVAAYEYYPSWAGWIVVSKTKPYECMVMNPAASREMNFYDWVDERITIACDDFKSHVQSGDWHNPKYDEVIELDIDLSTYRGY